ncbi:putative UDP-sugar transporter DDB_G0278631 [Patella vulgata]|uniref:putative UDP-sugar transporter DDB_G0278631 n=1 Tax=Patella vulgata TaxID=6465 RepID=UPI0024AA00D0|nr:putative UDP-sugar transporter DDB_G0278631 [Patella vulgata]
MSSKPEVIIQVTYDTERFVSSTIKSVGAATFYGVVSVATAFVNKGLMSTHDFDFPVIVMVAQMIFTIVLLETLRFFDLIDLPAFTLKRGRAFLWPAVFYGINAVLALSALSHMNIAMYGVLKRCVPISTLILSVYILKKTFPSKMTIISVVFLSVGCLIAGYGDLGFNPVAYICGGLSNFTQAVYLILVQKFSQQDMTTAQTLQLNSYNTLPLLLLYSCINREIIDMWQYKHFYSIQFIIMFFLAISMGCLLNYSLFMCASLTSALTTSVVGGLKALAQTLLGLFTFGGVSHNLATYTGISVNLSGGILYIFSKYRENRKNKSYDMKKVMSISSAEDFKDLANGHVVNGNPVQKSIGTFLTVDHQKSES